MIVTNNKTLSSDAPSVSSEASKINSLSNTYKEKIKRSEGNERGYKGTSIFFVLSDDSITTLEDLKKAIISLNKSDKKILLDALKKMSLKYQKDDKNG